jgi:hypothetical protein
MATIQIEVPDGKKAEWKNGVLTLVDEEKPKNVMERIKTLDDAMDELGEDNILVKQYTNFMQNDGDGVRSDYGDIQAYLALRIICAALNEGWEPQFTEDEYRYYPYFYLYTKEEYEQLSDEDKGLVWSIGRTPLASSGGGVSFSGASYDSSHTLAVIGSRLAFRTSELAEYAGKQFLDIWADFVFKIGTPDDKKK